MSGMQEIAVCAFLACVSGLAQSAGSEQGGSEVHFFPRDSRGRLHRRLPRRIAAGQAPPSSIAVPKDTPVVLRFRHEISSRDAFTGKLVEFGVAEDVVVNGLVVIAKGATARGVVEAGSHGAKRFDRRGVLGLQVHTVRDVVGGEVTLSWQNRAIGDHTLNYACDCGLGMVVVPLVLPFVKGEDVRIPKGATVAVRTIHDHHLELARVQEWNAYRPLREHSLTRATVRIYRVERGIDDQYPTRIPGVQYPPLRPHLLKRAQTVYLNDDELAVFPPDRALTVDLPAGEYKFRSDCPARTIASCRLEVDLTLTAGDKRYLRVGRSGRKKRDLEVTDAQTGEEENSWLDPLDAKNIRTHPLAVVRSDEGGPGVER